jgi:hypothetical protein
LQKRVAKKVIFSVKKGNFFNFPDFIFVDNMHQNAEVFHKNLGECESVPTLTIKCVDD